MKIGMYLGYAPYIKPMSLKQEGLGRYLAFLTKGFIEAENKLTIACPNWVVPLLDELFDEEGIDTDNVEILTSTSEPVLFRLYVKWINRSRKQKIRRHRVKRAVIGGMDWFVDILLRSRNVATFALLVMICGIIGLLSLPFLFVLLLLYGVLRIVRLILRVLHINSGTFSIKNLIKRIPRIEFFISSMQSRYSGLVMQEKIRRYSTDEIIRKAARMKDSPDVWYSPTAFWGEFNRFPGVRVICAPDLVTAEFPFKFSQGSFIDATKKISETIAEGTYFITYCEYLKNNLLLGKFFKGKEDVVVVPHAQNDLMPFLDLADYFKRVPFKEDVNRYFARNIIMPGILGASVNMHSYLIQPDSYQNFSFRDVDYLFYPSQVRGNKNILNLVKAYEYILRERNIPLKLVLTCNLNNDKELLDYIYHKRLQYDVLSFNSVTAQQLAALYMCAKLVVNPTLYEGGFPFTFGEGMSVKTPSVMSSIPQVTEVMQGYGLEDYLFDPYDYMDMSAKIEKGLKNRDDLIAKEQILYDQLKDRTWKDVCREYMQAFEYFIDRSKKNEAQVQN